MAITFVGTRTYSRTGGTTGTLACTLAALTGGSDSTPQAGDLCLVFYGTGSNATHTLSITDGTDAYQAIASGYVNAATTDVCYNCAYKFMGTTPDADFTVGATGSNGDGGEITVRVYRGVDQSVPLDVAAVVTTGTAGAQPDPGSITPATSGAIVVSFGVGGAATGATFSSSDLSNFVTDTFAATRDASIGSGDYAWSSGALDLAAWTGGGSGATNAFACVTLALRPQAADTGSPFIGSTEYGLAVNSTTCYVPVPRGAQSGDLMILCVSLRTDIALTTPPGSWTSRIDADGVANPYPNTFLFTKAATSNEPSYYKLTSASGAYWCASITVVRGFQWAANTGHTVSGSSTSQVKPSITVSVGSIEFFLLEVVTTLTPPGGATTLVNARPSGSANATGLYLGYRSFPSGGATGTLTATIGAADFYDSYAVEISVASIAASASITEGADTSSGTATLALSATLTVTEGGDSTTATATLAVTAALGITESGDSLSSAAVLALSATAALTESADSLSSAATLALTASVAITEGGDTAASTAGITLSAILAASEDADTATATATLALSATLAITNGADALTATAELAGEEDLIVDPFASMTYLRPAVAGYLLPPAVTGVYLNPAISGRWRA